MNRNYRKRMKMLLGYVPERILFSAIETCPICSQPPKPIEKYHVREIMHIRRHLQRERFIKVINI